MLSPSSSCFYFAAALTMSVMLEVHFTTSHASLYSSSSFGYIWIHREYYWTSLHTCLLHMPLTPCKIFSWQKLFVSCRCCVSSEASICDQEWLVCADAILCFPFIFFINTSLGESGFCVCIDILPGVAIGLETDLIMYFRGLVSLVINDSRTVRQNDDDGPVMNWWMVWGHL